MKCGACNGTGKAVSAVTPQGGVVLTGCGSCGGTGQTPELTQGQPLQPKPKKGKAKKAEATQTSPPDAEASLGEAIMGVFEEAGQKLLEAGKEVMATEVMKAGVNTTRALLASMGYDLPPNPVIDRALQNGAPLLLMLACVILKTQAPDLAPAALLEAVNGTALHAFKGQSRETIKEVKKIAVPAALQLVSGVAQAVPALMAGSSGQLGSGQFILDEETT